MPAFLQGSAVCRRARACRRSELGDLKTGIISGPSSPTKVVAGMSTANNLMSYYGRSMSLDRQDRVKTSPEEEKRR